MLVRVVGRHPDLGFSWNGRECYPGDELDMPDAYARALQTRGWVQPVVVEPLAAVAAAEPAPPVMHRDPGASRRRRR